MGKRQESRAGVRIPEGKISSGFLNIIINKTPAEILWFLLVTRTVVLTSHPDSTDYKGTNPSGNCTPKRKDKVQQSQH